MVFKFLRLWVNKKAACFRKSGGDLYLFLSMSKEKYHINYILGKNMFLYGGVIRSKKNGGKGITLYLRTAIITVKPNPVFAKTLLRACAPFALQAGKPASDGYAPKFFVSSAFIAKLVWVVGWLLLM